MTAHLSDAYVHGTKIWYHLTADTPRELILYARRLHCDIHGGEHGGRGQEPHLDLTPHQRVLALRCGAQEAEDE